KKVSIKVDVRAFVGAFETRYRNSDFYGIFSLIALNQAHSTVTFDNSLVFIEAMGIETIILEFNNIKVQCQNVGNHVINFNNRKDSRVVCNSSKSESIPRYIIALFSVNCSISENDRIFYKINNKFISFTKDNSKLSLKNKGIEILKPYFVPKIDQLELFYSLKKTDEQNILIYYLNEYEILCLQRNVLDLNIVTKDQFFTENKSNASSKKKLENLIIKLKNQYFLNEISKGKKKRKIIFDHYNHEMENIFMKIKTKYWKIELRLNHNLEIFKRNKPFVFGFSSGLGIGKTFLISKVKEYLLENDVKEDEILITRELRDVIRSLNGKAKVKFDLIIKITCDFSKVLDVKKDNSELDRGYYSEKDLE
ncbi:26091_t:CDS:2, partial [Gigaspora margarita]